MRLNLIRPAVVTWFLLGTPFGQALAAEVQLHIPPLFQERPDWCWAAVGEMVFKYYDVPASSHTDYQCDIAQSRKLCTNHPACLECTLPAADDSDMVTLLEQYAAASNKTIRLTAKMKAGRLSEAEVKQELDNHRPIIVSLSPSGFAVDGAAQHMALLVGYKEDSEKLTLMVNDPFPFEDDRFLWIGNPYINVHTSGPPDPEYDIAYDRFRGRLKWTRTIYGITCTGQDCPPDSPVTTTSVDNTNDRDIIHAVVTTSNEDFRPLRTGHKAMDPVQGTTWRASARFAGAKHCLVREKDARGHAQWRCTFKFDDREDADNAVGDIVNRVRQSLPDGWVGTTLDEDKESDVEVTTEKFSARGAESQSRLRVYATNMKKTGRVTIYLSVENE